MQMTLDKMSHKYVFYHLLLHTHNHRTAGWSSVLFSQLFVMRFSICLRTHTHTQLYCLAFFTKVLFIARVFLLFLLCSYFERTQSDFSKLHISADSNEFVCRWVSIFLNCTARPLAICHTNTRTHIQKHNCYFPYMLLFVFTQHTAVVAFVVLFAYLHYNLLDCSFAHFATPPCH